LLPAAFLHVLGERDADEATDSAETEEAGVAACGFDSASRAEVDEDIRAPAKELPPEGEEFAWAAGSGGVAEVAVDERGVFEDGRGGWGFGVDGKVGEETSLGVGKGAGDEMKGRKGNQIIAETA
jgi:hypothetical protein